MITASQILAHLWGDYILQSDWMANNRTSAGKVLVEIIITPQ